MQHPPFRQVLLILGIASTVVTGTAQASQLRCEAQRGAQAPAIVELYTSEGCSSCPPADRWLSGLKGQDDIVALAFHVNYWDRLGWRDPFAAQAHTERQYQLRDALGNRYVYTPQVVLNGQDHRNWRSERAAQLQRPAQEAPALKVWREGDELLARVERAPARNDDGRYAGYWAVLLDDATSQVTAGENAGEHLRHDHVVRHYRPVPPWRADQPHTVRWYLPFQGAHRVAFVVTNPTLTRPVQATVLSCPA